nr:MAG TPA: holin [Caudoviricetes sp.]
MQFPITLRKLRMKYLKCEKKSIRMTVELLKSKKAQSRRTTDLIRLKKDLTRKGVIDMQELLSNATILLAVVGGLAFTVSVITQVIKGIFKNVPTDLVVFVLSIALTVTAFIAYMQYTKAEMLWYMIVASVIAGFIVAFVAMFGWEKLSELWKRFGKDVK